MPTTRAAREGDPVKYEDQQYDEEDRYDEEDQYEEGPYDEDEAYDEEGEEYEEEEDDEEPGGPPANGGQVTTAGAAAKAAVEQIALLTAKQPEGVVAVEPGDEGWRVSVEVIEDQRIPSSADVLAIYEAAIAKSGDLTSYRRVSRYGRGHGDGGSGQ